MRLSKNFTLAELIKSPTALRLGINNYPPPEVIKNLQLVAVNILQPVRDHYGIPFSPSSGYRSPRLNTLIGGSKNSQHITGHAVDFEVPTISNFALAKWISENLVYDQLILELYKPGVPNSGWVHCSFMATRSRKSQLTYVGKGKYLTGLVA